METVLPGRSAPAAGPSSPPRVSEMVRNLEERLGVRLAERTTRSIAPTAAGERLLERVRPVLDEYQSALESTNEFRGRSSRPIPLEDRPGASRPGVAQDRGLDGAHGVSEAIPDLRGPRHGVGSSALSRRKAAFPTRPMQQSIGTAWRPSMSSRVRCAIAPESHREPVDTWGQRGSALARPGHALAMRMRLAEDHPGAPAG